MKNNKNIHHVHSKAKIIAYHFNHTSRYQKKKNGHHYMFPTTQVKRSNTPPSFCGRYRYQTKRNLPATNKATLLTRRAAVGKVLTSSSSRQHSPATPPLLCTCCHTILFPAESLDYTYLAIPLPAFDFVPQSRTHLPRIPERHPQHPALQPNHTKTQHTCGSSSDLHGQRDNRSAPPRTRFTRCTAYLRRSTTPGRERVREKESLPRNVRGSSNQVIREEIQGIRPRELQDAFHGYL